MNNAASDKTSRDLKLKKVYHLIDFKIMEESSYTGTYKKAYGTLTPADDPETKICISMPRPMTKLDDKYVKILQKNMEKGKYAKYVVYKITQKAKRCWLLWYHWLQTILKLR